MLIRRLLSLVAIFACPWLVAQEASTPPPSPAIAVVDLMLIFEKHPATAAATEELSEARETLRDEFKEKSNALKEILQKHQELIRAGNRDAAEEKLKEANEAEKAIATLRTTQQRDLEEEFRKTKHAIISEIQIAIASFNETGQYSLILDSSAKSSNGLPQVLHSPGATDITEEVLEFILNSQE